jgi:hypothetical protein
LEDNLKKKSKYISKKKKNQGLKLKFAKKAKICQKSQIFPKNPKSSKKLKKRLGARRWVTRPQRPWDEFLSDIGKIILKVILDQIKIIFSKNDFKSDQDHI